MNLIVLTNNGSLYGKELIFQILRSGLNLRAVVVINQPLSYQIGLFKYVMKKVGVADAIYFTFRHIINGHAEKNQIRSTEPELLVRYEEMAETVVYTDSTNGAKTQNILANFNTDVLILGQTGIIKKDILNIPRVGILNAHPGVLPYYRGINCHLWALYNKEYDKIGASVHWVDPGVDTGNIIETSIFDLPGGVPLGVMEKELYKAGILLMVKTIQRIVKGDIPKGSPQLKNDGKQYYKMPKSLENQVEKNYKELIAGMK